MMPSGPPSKAAIYIEDGAEDGAREYTAGQYTGQVKSGANGIIIEGAKLSSGDYSFTGVVATGEKSVVTLNHVTMKLGVTKEAGTKDLAGAALRGRVEVDGRPVMPVAGETYTGRITVTPFRLSRDASLAHVADDLVDRRRPVGIAVDARYQHGSRAPRSWRAPVRWLARRTQLARRRPASSTCPSQVSFASKKAFSCFCIAGGKVDTSAASMPHRHMRSPRITVGYKAT